MKTLVALVGATAVAVGLVAGTADATRTAYPVCAHGCEYRTFQAKASKAAPVVAAKRATKKVTVSNDFYAPTSVNVAKDGKVKWTWLNASDGHNVTLQKGPSGVKKNDFRSPTQTTGTFTRKFQKLGIYKFHCTIHPDLMQMTVKVSK